MGYDLDRFLGAVNEGLLCCICRDVLEDPVQAPCEHAYCRACIEGWLVQETRCPEDRQNLSLSDLRPLFRYMRNDLDKLKVRCSNHHHGCSTVTDLEFANSHEGECPYGTVKCPNERCSMEMTRRELQDHLNICEFQMKECPRGCGMLMVIPEDSGHNCVSELRTMVEVLRSEMTCKLEDQRHEMELRLNMQRGHMVQREATLQTQVDDLKSELSRMSQKIKLLMDLEIQRRQDIERLEIEKKELMELIKGNMREGAEGGASKGQPMNRFNRGGSLRVKAFQRTPMTSQMKTPSRHQVPQNTEPNTNADPATNSEQQPPPQASASESKVTNV